jgi:flagellin
MVDRLNNATGALSALKYLQVNSQEMSQAEGRLASGLKVQSARQDAAAYQTAAVMRGQGSSLNAVALSLGRAESISDTAITSAERVSKLLVKMQETAVAAMSEDLTPEQRTSHMEQFATQKEQLGRFIQSASFDDANILDGSKPNGVVFIADAEALQSLTLKGRNLMPGGPIVTLTGSIDLSSPSNASIAHQALTDSIRNVGNELIDMSGERKRIEVQKGFVGRLADAMAAGVGRMVDADLASESAMIQALQVKQQLSAQAVSIANDAPQALLALFRG